MSDQTIPLTTTGTPQAYLVSLSTSLVHREYEVRSRGVVVGRDVDSADVVCSGSTISRRHLRIHVEGPSRIFAEDLNSTNGVYVNGNRISKVQLSEGDIIGLGGAQAKHFSFHLQSSKGRSIALNIPARSAWNIGRWEGNDIPLPFESSASALHAVVTPRDAGRLLLTDKGSANGTWVNGRRITKTPLEPTDAVTIGGTVFHFELLGDGGLRVSRRDCGEDIALECISLTREVPNRSRNGARTIRILDEATLAIRPGEFVGLLGPSGAGKSTLLKAINGYNPPSYGCVLLNGVPLYRCFDMFRSTIGYVPQDDIVHQDLTVEASLHYVAQLRLPGDLSLEQRNELIDSTIETLGLSHVRTSRIRDLSGGQRKRVSIGCELITRPGLLYLDEPTSGLDPSTEEKLMRHFRSLARRGTTVLITTHILYSLDLLDRVVIMSRGRLVFFGTPEEARVFFGSNGKPLESATRIFDILEGELQEGADPAQDHSPATVAAHYQRKYAESELYRRHVLNELAPTSQEMLAVSREGDGKAQVTAGKNPNATEHRALLAKPLRKSKTGAPWRPFSFRFWLTLTRRYMAIKSASLRQIAFYLAVPLVLALVTLSLRSPSLPDEAELAKTKESIAQQIHGGPYDLGNPMKALLAPKGVDDPRPAEDVVFALKHEGLPNLPTPLSVLLMFVMTAIFMGTLLACLELSTERAIYQRERMANQKIADYLGSKLPFLFMTTAIQCLVFIIICRLKPGLRDFDLVGAYVAMVAMAWASVTLGLFLSALDPTPGQFSVILAIVAVLPQLVLSGGLAPDFYEGMPGVMKVIAAISPARWGLEMLMTAFYWHPERAALGWLETFVPETIGFAYGTKVYIKDVGVLALQGVLWLVLCAAILRRQDAVK